jgi:hypothetical protein
LNLGDYAFHVAIKELYPSVVANWFDLNDMGCPIKIGGVEEKGDGITVTHVVVYWLPYMYKGEQARVAFGLAEDVATSALVGIGFLRSTKALMAFTGDDPELQLQAVGASLPLFFEPPTRRVPPIRRDSTNAYQARPMEDIEDTSDDSEDDTINMM